MTGSKAERKGLYEALAYVRPGDTFVVWKMDRAGRSLTHLIELLKGLQGHSIEFISLTEQIDTTTRSIAPLPARIPPQPWEDLHSFLSHTAKHMQYEHVNHVIQPEMSLSTLPLLRCLSSLSELTIASFPIFFCSVRKHSTR